MHTQEDILLAEGVRKAVAMRTVVVDGLTVGAEHGTVTLTGRVANETERQNAVSAARSVPGVINVVDHLRVASQDSQTVGEYLDDTLITTAVKGKLLAEAGIKSLSINVETNQGVVTLSGNVDKPEQIPLSEHVAKQADGVRRVDNRLVLKP